MVVYYKRERKKEKEKERKKERNNDCIIYNIREEFFAAATAELYLIFSFINLSHNEK